MTVKELKDILEKFPDDTLLVTEERFYGIRKFATHFYKDQLVTRNSYIHKQLEEYAENISCTAVDADIQNCNTKDAKYCVLSVE